MRGPRLNIERRQVLQLLASSPHGLTVRLLLTYGFTRRMLTDLVHNGLAIAQPESTMGADGETIEVVRIRITEAGRGRLRASCDPRENTVDIIALCRLHDNRRQTSQINCCCP
jgi:hypothetical protein